MIKSLHSVGQCSSTLADLLKKCMYIDEDDCIGCDICVPYCPVEAISMEGDVAVIDRDTCVECGTCKRVDRCPTDAFYLGDIEYPRIVRKAFSDPAHIHEDTGIAGRGTEEMKTNDVTGRVDTGQAGLLLEFGRPGVSASFREIETVTTAIADSVDFEEENPLVSQMADVETGEMKEEVRDERVMSAIAEITLPSDELVDTLELVFDAIEDIETVVSINVSTVLREGDTLLETELDEVLEGTDYELQPNGKTNIGIGKATISPPPESMEAAGGVR
ncbi:MAG: DUF362 domain-containing protein [Halodesulfurarchaeum sp.]